jgi:hypothetical protein
VGPVRLEEGSDTSMSPTLPPQPEPKPQPVNNLLLFQSFQHTDFVRFKFEQLKQRQLFERQQLDQKQDLEIKFFCKKHDIEFDENESNIHTSDTTINEI